MGGYLFILFLFNIPITQQVVTRFSENILEDKIGSEVSIGTIHLGLFNRIILKDITLKDQEGIDLLKCGLATCKIEWAPLLKGEVSLRTISLLDGNICLYKKEKHLPHNFQFLIDAFKSKEEKKDQKLNLRINSIILRRCNISYNEEYAEKTEGKFNVSHLNFKDLNTNISLRQLTSDSINLRIRSFSIREQSGLQINNLTLRLAANRRQAEISKLELDLPSSHIEKKELRAHYNAQTIKELFNTFTLKGILNNSYLSTNDFSFALPQLKELNETFDLYTQFDINPQKIDIQDIHIQNRNRSFNLLSGITCLRENGKITNASANINKFEIQYPFLKKAITCFNPNASSESFSGIGFIKFIGSIQSTPPQKAILNGTINTMAGNAQTHLTLNNKSISGEFSSEDLDFSKITNNANLPNLAHFTLKGEYNLQEKEQPQASAILHIEELQHNHTTYKSIQTTAEWKKGNLSFAMDSNSPSLVFSAQGSGKFNGNRLKDFTSTLQLDECNPHQLNWSNRYPNTNFSSLVSLYIKDTKGPVPYGNIEVNDFKMKSEKDEYTLHHLLLNIFPNEDSSTLTLNSDFAKVNLKGDFQIQALKDYGNYLFSHYLSDTLQSTSINKQKLKEWTLSAEIIKTDFANKLFSLPLESAGTIFIEGNLRPHSDYLYLSTYCPGIKYNETKVEDIRIFLQGKNKQLNSLIQATKPAEGSKIQLSLSNNIHHQEIITNLLWDDGEMHQNKGEISINTLYGNDKLSTQKGMFFRSYIQPTSVTISDSVWKIAPGKIKFNKDNAEFHNLSFNHANQTLSINGRLSKQLGDSLHVDLNKINLAYVLNLIKFHAVDFSGAVSGEANIIGNRDSINGLALLDVESFKFNDSPMGPAKIIGKWNNKQKNIELDADMGEPGKYRTQVNGYISPAQKGLDLHIKSQKTDIRFLNKYVSGIFKDLTGHTTGEIRLFGPFKKLDFIGDEIVDLNTEIEATGVRYNISQGHLVVHPGHFDFDNITISDYLGHTGVVNGSLMHTHLKNLTYNFNVKAQNLLSYDKPKDPNMPFYATIYGTGDIGIKGGPGLLQTDISFTPTSQSQLTYILDNPDNFGEVKYITFREKRNPSRYSSHINSSDSISNISENVTDSQMDIRLNFLINMNPSTELKIIMDERSGDNIRIYGNGPIRANWYNKGEFNMFGTLNVERGNYKMSIQEVIRKNFEFSPGGRIVFAGDPYNADLDLKAIYTVNSASLSDLNIGSGFHEGTTRADCILNIRGKTNSPQINFELDLPNVNEEEKQMVKNLLSTEEDLNMQILYLLGVGRFYTYDYGSMEHANQSQSSIAMKSFLSNTLSNQLNEIITNAIGSSNWSFGTNLSTGQVGWSDMEVEGLIRGRLLNNRLLINGNFGYHDRPTMSTNFVGDFDVNYLLTPSGSVSLKAYSETNDRYFSKSSLTTQGIGILLKRDFYNLKDLFSIKKRRKAEK